VRAEKGDHRVGRIVELLPLLVGLREMAAQEPRAGRVVVQFDGNVAGHDAAGAGGHQHREAVRANEGVDRGVVAHAIAGRDVHAHKTTG